MTMTLIGTANASGSSASFEFTSIPQTGTDLYLVISTRNAESGYFGYAYVGFNGSTSNLTMRRLRGNGSSVSSGTNTDLEMAANASGTTSNTFNSAEAYIPNYTGSTNKSVSFDWVMENNVTEAYQQINAGLWSNTAAITSIQIYGFTNFAVGSTASLYTITKGSGGATVS